MALGTVGSVVAGFFAAQAGPSRVTEALLAVTSVPYADTDLAFTEDPPPSTTSRGPTSLALTPVGDIGGGAGRSRSGASCRAARASRTSRSAT